MNIEVKLNEEQVKEAIKEYLLKNFSDVEDVKLEIKKELKGYYTSEHYEYFLENAVCKVKL